MAEVGTHSEVESILSKAINALGFDIWNPGFISPADSQTQATDRIAEGIRHGCLAIAMALTEVANAIRESNELKERQYEDQA